jgi:hypothetical protein
MFNDKYFISSISTKTIYKKKKLERLDTNPGQARPQSRIAKWMNTLTEINQSAILLSITCRDFYFFHISPDTNPLIVARGLQNFVMRSYLRRAFRVYDIKP